jgi:hypothetical protein
MNSNDERSGREKLFTGSGLWRLAKQPNRGNDSNYNSQNDFLEDEEDDYGERMTTVMATMKIRTMITGQVLPETMEAAAVTETVTGNPSGYGNSNNYSAAIVTVAIMAAIYGNLWNRDNNNNNRQDNNSNRQDNNSSRRSRQGFGSMSKERRQEVASQGGRASHENR